MQKKGMTGLVGAVVGIAIAAVVAVIVVQIYNSVANTGFGATAANGQINGTSATVAKNIPVFIFLGLLVAAALFFAMK